MLTMPPREDSNPADFLCPISLELMEDPVILVETGHIYDRKMIEKWFQTNKKFTDPLTRESIKNPTLKSVPKLRGLIEQFRSRVVSDSLNSEAVWRRTGRVTSEEKSYDKNRRRRNVRIQIIKNPETFKGKTISKRFKIAFLGPSEAGKTSLIGRMTTGDFKPNIKSTIGWDMVSIGVKLGESLTMLEIWDTAGQERFMDIAVPLQVRGSQLVCLVYDITDPVSLEDAGLWLKTIRERYSILTIFLLGNKVDCIDSEQEWENALDIGQAFADEHDLIFFATSAKTGSEVESVLIEITRTLKAMMSRSQEHEGIKAMMSRSQEHEGIISLHQSKSGKCCKK